MFLGTVREKGKVGITPFRGLITADKNIKSYIS